MNMSATDSVYNHAASVNYVANVIIDETQQLITILWNFSLFFFFCWCCCLDCHHKKSLSRYKWAADDVLHISSAPVAVNQWRFDRNSSQTSPEQVELRWQRCLRLFGTTFKAKRRISPVVLFIVGKQKIENVALITFTSAEYNQVNHEFIIIECHQRYLPKVIIGINQESHYLSWHSYV